MYDGLVIIVIDRAPKIRFSGSIPGNWNQQKFDNFCFSFHILNLYA